MVLESVTSAKDVLRAWSRYKKQGASEHGYLGRQPVNRCDVGGDWTKLVVMSALMQDASRPNVEDRESEAVKTLLVSSLTIRCCSLIFPGPGDCYISAVRLFTIRERVQNLPAADSLRVPPAGGRYSDSSGVLVSASFLA